MTKRMKATSKMAAILIMVAGCVPVANAQRASATGQLYIYGSVEASYRVEVTGEGYTSAGQGLANGNNLRASVRPGPIAIRVLKANSSSGTYSFVVRGGKEDLSMLGLPYEATIHAVIPESQSDAPMLLVVIPD
jgi:hypothetical protein